MVYKIRIKGNLDQSWSDWLGDVEITSKAMADGTVITTLIVDVGDQTTLYGILDHLRDLNIPLITVTNAKNKGREYG